MFAPIVGRLIVRLLPTMLALLYAQATLVDVAADAVLGLVEVLSNG